MDSTMSMSSSNSSSSINSIEAEEPITEVQEPTTQTTSPTISFTRTKTYVYDDGVKVKKVTRTWVNKGVNINKREQLSKFFTENDEQLRSEAKSIKTLYNEYNAKQPEELKISYSMFNKHFNSYFAK